MKILFDKDPDPAALDRLLRLMEADPGVASVLVLAADGNGWVPQSVDAILQKAGKPVFGGIFPQVLCNEARLEQGAVVLGLPDVAQLAVIDSLSDAARNYEAEVDASFPTPPQTGTMFVFVDGFSTRIGALMDALFNNFGVALNYLGGGGGSLSLVQKPCVITPAGLKRDVAVLAYLDIHSGVGVAHGWEPVSVAHRVTESSGNVVVSLDWRPAFEVYREIIEQHSPQRFGDDNFFDIAKAYPLGIAKLGAELVVRDPLARDGQRLVCVGEVPTGAFVQVLHGDKDMLLRAAQQTRQNAELNFGVSRPSLELFVDCISRVLFLQNDFDQEVAAARVSGVPMVGALTIGEIANNGKDYLEFHNKTSVVTLI